MADTQASRPADMGTLGAAAGKALRRKVCRRSAGWKEELTRFATGGHGNVNASVNDGGDTLLHLACRSRAGADAVEALADLGAKIELENGVGHRALHEAALACDHGAAAALLARGADVDSLKHAGWTPLMLAASKPTGTPGLTETVRVLLGGGARHWLRNKDGWTALHVAARGGDAGTVAVLLNADATDGDDGSDADGDGRGVPSTAATAATTAATATTAAATTAHSPAALRHDSANGRTPLHTAALHGHADVLKLLLADSRGVAGAVDVANSCGQTALHCAVVGGSAPAVALLLDVGASIDATDASGANVLHMAASAGDGSEYFHTTADEAQANLRQLLRELDRRDSLRAAANSPDRLGLRPLHYAAIEGHARAADALLAAGADARLADGRGRTAAAYARQAGRTELAEAIEAAAGAAPASPPASLRGDGQDERSSADGAERERGQGGHGQAVPRLSGALARAALLGMVAAAVPLATAATVEAAPLVLDDSGVHMSLQTEQPFEDRVAHFAVCGFARDRRGEWQYEAPLLRRASRRHPAPAVQLELSVESGDPDMFVSVGSERGEYPTATDADYTAATFGAAERILVPTQASGPVLVTVVSRWPSNSTFRLRALSAQAEGDVSAKALNMDALNPSSYTRGFLRVRDMFESGSLGTGGDDARGRGSSVTGASDPSTATSTLANSAREFVTWLAMTALDILILLADA